ncbi:methyltransferase [Serratia sp. S1B]|nr:methyltransferase [Serratia sp. S1B]
MSIVILVVNSRGFNYEYKILELYMAELNRARFYAAINSILRRVGFQVVRVQTLERLVATEKNIGIEPVHSIENISPSVSNDVLESRLVALETRTEQSFQNLIRYAMKAHWRTVDLVEEISGKDKPNICPLCGHDASLESFKEIESNCIFYGGRLLRHECPSCNVIFGPQKMFALDEEMLDLDYRNLYRIYSEGNSTESIIRTFHLLHPKKNGVYLDFGCGGEWSEAIQRLRADGWNIYGFEPSANHSSEYVFSKWDELSNLRFDGILTHNVLEHLFDPVDITIKLKNLLVEDGRIVHATACFDYLYDFTHYHVYFFTGRSTEVLAKKTGMSIIDWVRDGEYIACILKKNVNEVLA